MAFRPPSLRTSRPRSPVNRSTPWGREVLIVFGLVVVMAVVLLAIHSSSINTTLRIILGFSAESEQDDSSSVGHGRLPGLCAHNGIDASLTPHQEQVLRSLNIESLSDRLSLMCHLSISDLSVPVAGGFASELRRSIFPTRICCADFDVFLSSEGDVFVGRPAVVALHISVHRAAANASGAPLTTDVASIEGDLFHNAISRSEIIAADPKHKICQPLTDIALVVGRVISTQSNFIALHGPNSTRITLEPKLADTVPPARTPMERGNIVSLKEARAQIGRSSKVDASHPIYIGDAVQLIAKELSHVADLGQGIKPQSKGYALWEYFGVIIDPIRYASSWDRLMTTKPTGVIGGRDLHGPEGFTVLLTEPQLWYVMSLKDVVLDALASSKARERSIPSEASSLKPEDYCGWMLQPPRWAREVAPSVTMQRRCVKWFDVEVSTTNGSNETTSVVLHRRMRSSRKAAVTSSGESWNRATRRIPSPRRPIVSWLVDTLEDYERVVYLGDRDGLKSSYVISNRPQVLHAEAELRFVRRT